MKRNVVRRHPLVALLLLLMLLLLGWGWQERVALAAFPDILSAYTAKEYCSCRYVAGQSDAYCRGYVKQYLPLSGLLDDAGQKRVTASGLGRSNTAVWTGARQGCRLLP